MTAAQGLAAEGAPAPLVAGQALRGDHAVGGPRPADAREAARSFAALAGTVAERERNRQGHEQGLLGERARLGRDLDTVVQRLFAAGLALRDASDLVTDPVARQPMRDAVDHLDRTIDRIRAMALDIEVTNRTRTRGVDAP